MFNLRAADVVVLSGYILLITVVGIYVSRRVKRSADYFMGGRKFGKLLMIGQSFGIGSHTDQPVGVAGAVYQMGIAAIWFQWKYIFCTPFYWILSPIFRRVRCTTTADFYDLRYGKSAGMVYVLFALLFFMLGQGVALKGAAIFIWGATGGAVDAGWAAVALTAAFIVYSFMGGLVSVAVTEFIQGFFVIAMSVLLIPYGLSRVGGAEGLHRILPPEMFDLWKSPDPKQAITPFFIAILSINSLVGIFTQPHIMASVGSGRTEMNSRFGFTYGNFIKRFCTVGWAYTGLVGAALLPGLSASDREQIFGLSCRELLPVGGVGLMIACVLAASLDNCSAFMVNMGALFTENIYRPYLRPGASDRRCLWMGRIMGLVFTLAGIGFTWQIPLVLDGFLLTENLSAFMGISFVAAVIWKRANRFGAVSSFLVSLGVYYVLAYFRCLELEGRFLFKTWVKWYADISLWSLAAGVVTVVVASLLTRPEPKDRIDEFYGRLHTPATGGQEPAAGEGGTS